MAFVSEDGIVSNVLVSPSEGSEDFVSDSQVGGLALRAFPLNEGGVACMNISPSGRRVACVSWTVHYLKQTSKIPVIKEANLQNCWGLR